MKFGTTRFKIISLIIFAVILGAQIVTAGITWYDLYKSGLKAMESGSWQQAADNFEGALKYEATDSNKKRVGTMFIEYYPHRELGICYYNLGNYARAKEQLGISINQSNSDRAGQYYQMANAQHPGDVTGYQEQPVISQPATTPAYQPTEIIQPEGDQNGAQLVGDRMCIAVLPFETRGIGGELGEINLFDKLITEFIRLNRFKVIERSRMERILEEQKLGLTGVIDANKAVEVGKMAGVDAVVFGSIASDKRTVTIDARLVDTETGEIITSRDAFGKSLSLAHLSEMIADVAVKIKNDLPVIDGIVVSTTPSNLTIDIGSSKGLRKGMKCYVYREGEPIIHPITGDTLDIKKDIICEAQVADVFSNYSEAKPIKYNKGIPESGDRVQTK
jgi:TolB-like protein